MPIAVQCGSCQKRFAAKEELAGRKVKCPQCGGVLTIPQPGAGAKAGAGAKPGAAPKAAAKPKAAPRAAKPPGGAAAASPPAGKAAPLPLGPAGGAPAASSSCPACSVPLQADAVLCIHCGFDLRTGKLPGAPSLQPTTPKKSKKKKKPEKQKKSKKKKKKKSDASGLPVAQLSILGASCVGLIALGIGVFIMFMPLATKGIGSSGLSETPKEFEVAEFGESSFQCENPKGWEVEGGGDNIDVPVWTRLEKGGASIEIRGSVSGTAVGMLERAHHIGDDVRRGEAPVDQVHEKRKESIAAPYRGYEESAPQKLEHRLGNSLIAEFTSNPMFGSTIHGYHATVLFDFHQFTIVCRCKESEWEMLKPTFDHVISTLMPVMKEDFGVPGI